MQFPRIAAVVAAAAIVVAAAVAVSRPNEPTRAAPPPSSLLTGIPEHGGVLGDPAAPLTLVEFVDPQCPVCAEAAARTLPTVVDRYVRTGKVKLEARVLHFIGPDSVRAARAAAGAEREGGLWRFLEALYANQGAENSGYVTDTFLKQTAQAAGLDPGRVLNAGSAQRTLDRANADAQRLGVTGTPTFAVARGDGPAHVLQADPLDPTAVSAALHRELAR